MGMDFRGQIRKRSEIGSGFGEPAAHVHQEFSRVPPPPPPRSSLKKTTGGSARRARTRL